MADQEKIETLIRGFFQEVIRKFQTDPSHFIAMISVFYEENGEDHIEVFAIEPDLMDSPSSKMTITQQVKGFVKAKKAQAVTHIINADYIEIPKESELVKRIMSKEINLQDALRQGLCSAKEALVCSFETPLSMAVFRQKYTYENGRVVLGEFTEARDPTVAHGRMTGFFSKSMSTGVH